MEIELTIFPNNGPSYTISVDVTDSTTTNDVIETVKDIVQSIEENSQGKWTLHEKWMQMERKLSRHTLIMQLIKEWGSNWDDVRLIARERKRQQRNAAQSKNSRHHNINKLRKELASCQDNIRHLRLINTKRSNTIQEEHDPAKKGLKVITSLHKKLEDLKIENKRLSSEVSGMNHEHTSLGEHLTALRHQSQQVVEQLTQLKTENQLKQEKEDEMMKKELRKINESIHQVQHELEKRQRMTELQDSKIKKVQKEIDVLKSTLESKQSELEQLKEWATGEKKRETKPFISHIPTFHQHHQLSTSTGSQVGPEPVLLAHRHIRDESFSCESTTSFESFSSFGSGFSRRHSGSIRRRFVDFEDRTRKLLEEESMAFKEAQPEQEGGKNIDSPITTDKRPSQLSRETSYSMQQLVSQSSTASAMAESSPSIFPSSQSFYSLPRHPKKGSQQQSPVTLSHSMSLTNLERPKPKGILKKRRNDRKKRKGRGMRFAPEAIILNAAWEGELDLLKDCIKELDSNYRVTFSGLGVTCLHNAVCSGNLVMMDYLIQLDYDINAQDYQGWSPLHCASAYCILGAVQLLLKHGASIFLTTTEKMTPTDIAKEESEGMGREEAKLCHRYLEEYQNNMGVANGSVVFSLFRYTPESASHWSTGGHRGYHHHGDPQDMALIKGERLVVIQRGEDGWWEVEDSQGVRGVVPMSYLGLYPPHQILL